MAATIGAPKDAVAGWETGRKGWRGGRDSVLGGGRGGGSRWLLDLQLARQGLDGSEEANQEDMPRPGRNLWHSRECKELGPTPMRGKGLAKCSRRASS